MPITITVPQPLNAIGPGLTAVAQTSIIGPFPTTALFSLTASTDNEGQFAIVSFSIPSQSHIVNWQLLGSEQARAQTPTRVPANGSTVYLLATHSSDGTTVDDSGNLTTTWDDHSGLGFQINGQGGGTTGGGLTSEQAAQLTQASTQTNQILGLDTTYQGDTIATLQTVIGTVLNGITATLGSGVNAITTTIGNIFSGNPMTALTEGDLGTACAPDMLTATLPIGGSAYGLQIQVTSYPDYIAFTGAGDTYTEQSLGTLELARSGNVVLRKGLHTTTDLIYPLPGVPTFPIGLELPLDPGNYSLTIWPAPNCCVAAQLLGFP